jgi:ATP-dependent protease Clp ATPase subunit
MSAIYCSFCGKSSDEVLAIVTAKDVSICEECVGLAVEIVEGHRIRIAVDTAVAAALAAHAPAKPVSIWSRMFRSAKTGGVA